MKTKLISWIGPSLTLVLASAVVLSQALPQRSVRYEELPNFHQVNEKLYRGAQPKKDGLKRLTDLGIKTVVSLREENELARREETEARAAGLRYFNIPLKQTGRPTDQQVEQVLAILESAENQPVFVHCRLGVDRTGMIIALYRISHDGWTSERAKAEANERGMHIWEMGMKSYISDYYKRRQISMPGAAKAPARAP